VRVDCDVRVVVEVLPVSVPIVRLQQAEQTAAGQLAFQLTQYAPQFVLCDVLEQVAGKGKVHRAALQERQVGDASHVALDILLDEGGHFSPYVEGNAPAGYYVVDEVAITGAQLEHAIFRANPTTKIKLEEGPPQDFAARVVFEAGLMITQAHSHASRLHPNVSPQIMREPTLSARRLLTLPPLLKPTRG